MSVDSFQTSGHSPGVDFNRPAALVPPATRCRVALLGFGTVGSAVARRLAGADPVPGIDLTHIFDRRAHQKRDAHPLRSNGPRRAIAWTDRFDDVLTSDTDIIVEAVGGLDPAAAWIRASLLAGKSVVTANKQVVARHGAELWRLAARQGRQLRFEAAVGGAMPIVRAVGEGLAGDRITRLVAILNGTSTAVLSRMDAAGCSLDEAVADACRRGYAEADPSADLDGRDACAKLSILCALAFGVAIAPDRIDARSIATIDAGDVHDARVRGGTIRQLASAKYDRAESSLRAWVAPAFVPRTSTFARTTGPQNAAIITGAHAGDVSLCGAGAGGDATAVAVVGDLLAIARDRSAVIPAPSLSAPRQIHGLDRRTRIVTWSDQCEDCVERLDAESRQGGFPRRPVHAEAL